MWINTTDFGTRTLNDPSVPLSDPDAWMLGLSANSATGVSVNRSSTLSIPAALNAIRIGSFDLARVPLILWQKTEAGGRKRAINHKMYDRVRMEPNREMSAFQFWSTMMLNFFTSGNSFALITEDELLPLDSDHVRIMRVGEQHELAGSLVYEVVLDAAIGSTRLFPHEKVLHLRSLSFDGVAGISNVEAGREDLGLSLAQTEYAGTYFRNNAIPRVVLQADTEVPEKVQKDIRRKWANLYEGLENSHRTAILTNGLTAHTLADGARDAALIEGREQQIRNIAALFNISPHRLGDPNPTSYASLEQENLSDLRGLDPHMVQIEQECFRKLLTEQEKRTYEFEFLRKKLVATDIETQSDADRKALAGGAWKTLNEVRAEQGLDPVPDGDEVIQPTNNFDPGVMSPDGDDSGRSLLIDRIYRGAEQRMKSRLCNAAINKTLHDFITTFDAKHDKVLRENLTDVCTLTGRDVDSVISKMKDDIAAIMQNVQVEGLETEEIRQELEAWKNER